MRLDALLKRMRGHDPKPMAAVDIGPLQVRWALLDRHAQQWRLQLRQWPVMPGWLEDGHLMDYPAVADVLSQGLAEAGVHRLAMTLPAQSCHFQFLPAPSGFWRVRRRSWLQEQVAQGPCGHQVRWAAHLMEAPSPGWRVLSAPPETVQDWQGLAEAAQCELICLEEVHQAGWRALDQWHVPASGACLFQVSATCVQTLQERSGHWQWAWRVQGPQTDPLERCLEFARNCSVVYIAGEGELASRIRMGLEQAGLNPCDPSPIPELALDGDFTPACWPVLGLAGLRWWP